MSHFPWEQFEKLVYELYSDICIIHMNDSLSCL